MRAIGEGTALSWCVRTSSDLGRFNRSISASKRHQLGAPDPAVTVRRSSPPQGAEAVESAVRAARRERTSAGAPMMPLRFWRAGSPRRMPL
jgi:hypothetical protein